MRFLACLAVVLTGLACEARRVDVTIKNATPELIYEAHIESGDFESMAGDMNPGVSKTHKGITRELPKHVNVHWRNSAGRRFSRRVAVPDLGYGKLVFEIRADSTVKVSVLAPGDNPI
jgi:hypothetical protein